MPKVRTLRPHAQGTGLGVWKRGQVYEETSFKANEKVRVGLVEFVDAEIDYGKPVLSKESPEMYSRITVQPLATEVPYGPEDVSFIEKRGSWFFFSDGEKALGKTAAAEKLGITAAELEALNVDPIGD